MGNLRNIYDERIVDTNAEAQRDFRCGREVMYLYVLTL